MATTLHELLNAAHVTEREPDVAPPDVAEVAATELDWPEPAVAEVAATELAGPELAGPEVDPVAGMLTMTAYAGPRLNLDMLAKVRDVIAERPAEHNQSGYAVVVGEGQPWCHTTRCVAGWTTKLAGISDDEASSHVKGYAILAADLLGLTAWQYVEDDDHDRDGMDPAHPFSCGWDHAETVANLDALVTLARAQQNARP